MAVARGDDDRGALLELRERRIREVREAAKIGNSVSIATTQPATMMRLRPMRSDNRPNTTKNGVPINSAIPTSMYDRPKSTFNVFCRKNSA